MMSTNYFIHTFQFSNTFCAHTKHLLAIEFMSNNLEHYVYSSFIINNFCGILLPLNNFDFEFPLILFVSIPVVYGIFNNWDFCFISSRHKFRYCQWAQMITEKHHYLQLDHLIKIFHYPIWLARQKFWLKSTGSYYSIIDSVLNFIEMETFLSICFIYFIINEIIIYVFDSIKIIEKSFAVIYQPEPKVTRGRSYSALHKMDFHWTLSIENWPE